MTELKNNQMSYKKVKLKELKKENKKLLILMILLLKMPVHLLLNKIQIDL